MMQVSGKCLFFLLVIILFCDSLFVWADSGNNKKIDELLKTERNELQILKEKINKQNKAISRMGSKKISVLKQKRLLDDQLKARERELNIYRWNLKKNKNNIKLLNENIKAINKELDFQRLLMKHRLRSIFKQGAIFFIS